eukprot:jgi/Botrbrau1/19025/Bobra.0100s0055.1
MLLLVGGNSKPIPFRWILLQYTRAPDLSDINHVPPGTNITTVDSANGNNTLIIVPFCCFTRRLIGIKNNGPIRHAQYWKKQLDQTRF